VILITAAGLAILGLAGLRAVRESLPAPGDDPAARSVVWRALEAVVSKPLPRYAIEVDPEQYVELVAQASRAEQYRLWVPAQFRAGGAAYGVEVQIDAAPDGRSDGPVWRVHFHGNQRYRGMADLALAPARDEADVGEVVAASLARKLGLLAAPSGFSRLRINGADAGVVRWTEGRSTAMFLGLGYDAGPVFAVGTEPGDEPAVRVTYVAPTRHAFADGDDARIDAVARKLDRLLELVRDASDAEFAHALPGLLNVEKYIAWNALSWLYGSPSADLGPDVRWYFDPVTGLFEPFLATLGRRALSIPTESLAAARRSPIGARLFEIDRYREQRNRALWRLLNDPGFDVAAAGHRRFRQLPTHIAGDAGARSAANERQTHPMHAVLTRNADRLRAMLAALTPESRPQLAHAGFTTTARRPLAVTVYAAGPVDRRPGFTRVPIPMRAADPLSHRWANPGSMEIVPASAVAGAARSAAVFSPASVAPFRGLERATARSLLDLTVGSGLPFERRGDALVLPAGEYTLTQDLIVPADYRIVLEPGVSLRLGPGVSVLTFRALTARGTPAQPIRIGPVDPDRPWGAFGVVRAPEASHLEHVAVGGGSRGVVDGVELAGQLAFNASDLDLRASEIRDARGGEGLSVKRGRFEVVRTRFVNNGLDGLDAEWARGSIRDSVFAGNGDDGLDLAGARIRVSNSSFRDMRDKAISAGEDSVLRIADSEISRSRTALVSKEGSWVEVVRTDVVDNDVGFSLYRGKSAFGGGRGHVRGGRFSGNRRDIEIESGSHLGFENANDDFASLLDAVGRWFVTPRGVVSAAD
jgi:hypothetical protein